MVSSERLEELGEKYQGYKVYDVTGEKIGKVDDLFVDESANREEYIGVKMGLFGLSGTSLIPMELVRVDEQDRIIEVAESKDRINDAPRFNGNDEITSPFEDRIRRHFGLESLEASVQRGSYNWSPETHASETAASAAAEADTSRGEVGDEATEDTEAATPGSSQHSDRERAREEPGGELREKAEHDKKTHEQEGTFRTEVHRRFFREGGEEQIIEEGPERRE